MKTQPLKLVEVPSRAQSAAEEIDCMAAAHTALSAIPVEWRGIALDWLIARVRSDIEKERAS